MQNQDYLSILRIVLQFLLRRRVALADISEEIFSTNILVRTYLTVVHHTDQRYLILVYLNQIYQYQQRGVLRELYSVNLQRLHLSEVLHIPCIIFPQDFDS